MMMMQTARVAGLWVILAAGLTAAGCGKQDADGASKGEASAACDTVGLRNLMEVTPEVAAELRPAIGAAGLREACKGAGRTPPQGLDQVLAALSSAAPDQQAVLVAKGISLEPALFGKACAGGVGLLASLATMAPDQRQTALLDGCRFDPEGRIASRAEYLAAPSNQLLAAMMTTAWMGSQAESGDGRAAVRLLLGL